MLRNLFKNYIKRWLFRASRRQQRVVQIINLKSAKSIGILWNPSDDQSIDAYESLRKILKDRNINTTGIAYINSKREKETLSTVSHSLFMSSSDVGFFGKPKNGDGIQFLQQEFDILVDLSIKKVFALQYFLIHSSSGFKVGYSSGERNYYDLEIDITANPTCNYLIEHLIFYLDTINEISK